jgi:aminoglycoside phosphotransferase (APT) family kinase protein
VGARPMSEHAPDDCLAGIADCLLNPQSGTPGRQSGRGAVTGVRRRRSDYASSYEADILTVQFAGGEEVQVFFKNLGVTRCPKDGARQRRDREQAVYRDLLAGADLGTPRYYGSVWDECLGRYWLFLEFVEGAQLRSCELDFWAAAAGWLGRLQGYFAPRSGGLGAYDFLARHDADFFRSKAEQALREVGQISRPLADRLAGVLSDYGRLVGVLAAPPRTLVHGNYRPSNILVVPGPGAVRVCPVDWEQAAWGPAHYDLAYLCDGFEPPELDHLLEAYRQEAVRQDIPVPALGGLRQAIVCFRLFMAVNRLSRACERGFPETKVAKTVALAEGLHRRAFAGRAGA